MRVVVVSACSPFSAISRARRNIVVVFPPPPTNATTSSTSMPSASVSINPIRGECCQALKGACAPARGSCRRGGGAHAVTRSRQSATARARSAAYPRGARRRTRPAAHSSGSPGSPASRWYRHRPPPPPVVPSRGPPSRRSRAHAAGAKSAPAPRRGHAADAESASSPPRRGPWRCLRRPATGSALRERPPARSARRSACRRGDGADLPMVLLVQVAQSHRVGQELVEILDARGTDRDIERDRESRHRPIVLELLAVLNGQRPCAVGQHCSGFFPGHDPCPLLR